MGNVDGLLPAGTGGSVRDHLPGDAERRRQRRRVWNGRRRPRHVSSTQTPLVLESKPPNNYAISENQQRKAALRRHTDQHRTAVLHLRIVWSDVKLLLRVKLCLVLRCNPEKIKVTQFKSNMDLSKQSIHFLFQFLM